MTAGPSSLWRASVFVKTSVFALTSFAGQVAGQVAAASRIMKTDNREQMTEDVRQNYSPAANESYQQTMNTAVRILANRDHSKYELKKKLQKRGFASQSINSVLAECERFGYIDDKRTARIYILQLKRKCFGKRYIQQALKKKRLSGAAIEEILSQNYPGDDEYEHAGRLLEKKKRTFAREADPKKKSDKIYRFLYSRGFSPEVISDLIRNDVK